MTCKSLMAIHTFHSDEAKQEFFGGMPESETTDREWAEGWPFEKPILTVFEILILLIPRPQISPHLRSKRHK